MSERRTLTAEVVLPAEVLNQMSESDLRWLEAEVSRRLTEEWLASIERRLLGE